MSEATWFFAIHTEYFAHNVPCRQRQNCRKKSLYKILMKATEKFSNIFNAHTARAVHSACRTFFSLSFLRQYLICISDCADVSKNIYTTILAIWLKQFLMAWEIAEYSNLQHCCSSLLRVGFFSLFESQKWNQTNLMMYLLCLQIECHHFEIKEKFMQFIKPREKKQQHYLSGHQFPYLSKFTIIISMLIGSKTFISFVFHVSTRTHTIEFLNHFLIFIVDALFKMSFSKRLFFDFIFIRRIFFAPILPWCFSFES